MLTTTAIILVAAATSAYAAHQSAEAKKDVANYNAAVEKNNATMAAQQAEFDAQQIRDRNRKLLAAQRAAFAASGVDAGGGSALDVYSDTAYRGELEALAAIYTGKTSATAHTAQARLDRFRADDAETAGYIGVGSSLLESASNPYFRRE